VIPISLNQQPQEKVADEVRDAEDGNSGPEQAQTAQRQMHEREAENSGSHTRYPECRDSSQMTDNEEEEEEDEEPWPAKWRKRNSQLTRQTPVHIEQHISQTSRSPPTTIAEYQEWPFEGFLKRTRIGNETKYSLEFNLPCMSKLLRPPTETCDDKDVPTMSATRRQAPYSKVSTPASQARTRVG
jgi:hypothetical protein